MTLPAPELAIMKQDMSGLVMDWGVASVIKRKTVTRNAAGQVSAPLATVGSDTLWIQPYNRAARGGVVTRIDPGILDKSTHECYQRFSGYAMQADDQIVVSGDNYAYDVLSVNVVQTHRYLLLQQVKRS